MKIPRRDFLGALLCASGVLSSGCSSARNLMEASVAPNAPLITNYNDSGEPLIVEGKTLLISLVYPWTVENLSGSLPVQIEPESAGGELLTEPQPLFFYPDKSGRILRTIISAPLDCIEDRRNLQLTKGEQPGAELSSSFPYIFRRGGYRSTTLTLDKDFSSPTPEIIKQQRRDFHEMLEILKMRTKRQWQRPFILPVDNGDNDNFGVRRTVNGTKRYRHRGLDFHAEMGTSVRAINKGRVVLAKQQWTAGQAICIDHGGSIFSKYAHLSKFLVGQDQIVERGEVIGLSGDSGGQKPVPHLHLDIIINGTHVDPKDFMRTAAQLIAVESSQK